MLDLNEQIAFLNGVLERLAHKDEQVSRLCTVPQVGPVTACAFVSAVDEPARFSGPHHVEAYLGLVPGERNSGEKEGLAAVDEALMWPPVTEEYSYLPELHRVRGELLRLAGREDEAREELLEAIRFAHEHEMVAYEARAQASLRRLGPPEQSHPLHP